MRNKISIFMIITFFITLILSSQVTAKKTYIYAWELPPSVSAEIFPDGHLKDGEMYVLYWASPWPIYAREKIRILRELPLRNHIHKGYEVKIIKRKLVDDGTFKIGLVEHTGGEIKIASKK